MGIHAPYFYTFRLTESGDCVKSWEPAFNHELTHPRYYTALFVVVVILPFTLITILYSVILWTLIVKKDEISAHRSYTQREKNDEKKKKKKKKKNKKKELRDLRVLRMAVSIVLAFAVCWAPFNVQQFMYIFARDKLPQCSLAFSVYSQASLVLAVAYCTVNPVICFIFMKNYRLQESLASLRTQMSSISKSSQRETEL